MKRYLVRLAVSLLLLPTAAKAQLLGAANELFYSADQKFVKAAIDSSLLIVRQDYILKDMYGNEFGRSGKSYFGRNHYLGVRTAGKIWLPAAIENPWLTDRYFIPYAQKDSIKPQLTGGSIRNTFVKEYSDGKDFKYARKDTFITSITAQDSLQEISHVFKTTESEGWLVIVSVKEELSVNENAELIYTIYKANPQFTNDSIRGLIKKMPVTDHILGGIYFTTNVTLGNITFSAAGLLAKTNTNWIIASLDESQSMIQSEILTPIDRKNEKRNSKHLKIKKN